MNKMLCKEFCFLAPDGYFEFGIAVPETSFKDFSTFSFGGHIFHQSRTIWSILVESLIRKFCVKMF